MECRADRRPISQAPAARLDNNAAVGYTCVMRGLDPASRASNARRYYMRPESYAKWRLIARLTGRSTAEELDRHASRALLGLSRLRRINSRDRAAIEELLNG